MNKQSELDAIYSKLARDYGKLNDTQVAFAIKEVGRVRSDITELLSEFAEKDGTVKRQRLSRLLRELDGVEKALRENGTVALTKSIKESTEFVINGMNEGTKSIIGRPLVSAGIEKLNKQTVDYVIRRFGDDGLVLSDRIWGTSGEIRDSISSVIRSGIIRGDSVGSMVRDVRKAYDAETWKIKRLVVTEGNTAYRVASANSVRQSDVADYVKINENGSRHGNHTNHRCYKLAKIDKYGEGNGIYKPTDTEIYMPHPQCSSYITAVILDKYLTGDFGGESNKPNTEAVAEETNTSSNTFKPAKDIKEAQTRASDVLGGSKVNLGKMQIDLANSYLEGIEKFVNDFPEIKGFVQVIDTKTKARNIGSFAINQTVEKIDGVEYADFSNVLSIKSPKEIESLYKSLGEDVKSNFHYKGYNPQTVVYHELVHALDALIGMTETGVFEGGRFVRVPRSGKRLSEFTNSSSYRVVEKAKKEMYGKSVGKEVYDGTKYLGKYSLTNSDEMLAEAISYLATGETHPYSEKMFELFRQRVKEVLK